MKESRKRKLSVDEKQKGHKNQAIPDKAGDDHMEMDNADSQINQKQQKGHKNQAIPDKAGDGHMEMDNADSQINQKQNIKYNTRLNPQAVKEAVEELSDKARKSIENDMDFGAMLKISLDWFPMKLVVALMERCEFLDDAEHIELVVGDHRIPLSPQVVKDLLGLPLGEDTVDEASWQENVEEKKKIKGYFGIIQDGDDVKAASIIGCMKAAKLTKQIRGFFVVLLNKFLSPPTTAYIRGSDFKITKDVGNFAKKNWCLYVYNKLVEAILWMRNPLVKPAKKDRYVPGCGVILLLLLLDKLKYGSDPKDYTIPAICHYTSQDVAAMILKFEINRLVFGTCVANVKMPIATKVAGKKKRMPIAVVPYKAPELKATTHKAGKIRLPEEMESFWKEYSSSVATTVDWLQHSKAMMADFMNRMPADLLAKTLKCSIPSPDLSASRVYLRRKKWYQQMIVDRAHVNKNTGLYIALMIDGWSIREYQFVSEFKPYGLLSNDMMQIISRLWNVKYHDVVILEMPAVTDLRENKSGSVLMRQLSQENLEGKKKIFVPVLDNGHWFFIVVDLSRKLKYVLDSMKPKNVNQLSIDVLQSLEHELNIREYDISDYEAITPDVAEQENHFDCGFHVLLYITRDPDTLATISQDDIRQMRMQVAYFIFHHQNNKVFSGLEDGPSTPLEKLRLKLAKAKEKVQLKMKYIPSSPLILDSPLRRQVYNVHGQGSPPSAAMISKKISKMRTQMSKNVGNNMAAKGKANVENDKKRTYADAQFLVEIPERLKESTIHSPYILPPRKEADSVKSLQLLKLIEDNVDYHEKILIECHSEPERPHDIVSLTGNGIKTNFSENTMCDGQVLTFFIKCLKQDESQECVGYRLIIPPQIVGAVLEKSAKKKMASLVDLIKECYTAEEVVNAHQIFIPVFYNRHWTLYVINFRHEQVDILDSMQPEKQKGFQCYHNMIGKKLLQGFHTVFSALTDKRIPNFISYTRYLHNSPQQEAGSNDCLFYVASFVEKYNADTRDLPFNSSMTSEERRAKLLHYLVFHDLNTATLPADIENLK